MKFTFYHNNINVLDLEKSISFYQKALGLTVSKEVEAEDGSFKLVFLGDGATPHLLELTWLRDMDRPYNLGDNEFHLAFHVDDMDAALALHKEMIVYALRIPRWASTLSVTQTDTGWKSVLRLKCCKPKSVTERSAYVNSSQEEAAGTLPSRQPLLPLFNVCSLHTTLKNWANLLID